MLTAIEMATMEKTRNLEIGALVKPDVSILSESLSSG